MMRNLLFLWGFTTACGGGSNGPSLDAGADATPPDADQVIVGADLAIDSGPIHGTTDADLVEFRGVPYARAARWMPPAPPAPWTTPLDATAFGLACPQANHPALPQGEDCLLLNVWAHASGPRRPVIVWIHGGGYVEGSAREPQYDGAALARSANAIVVSFDYRLGVLGFLALPQLAATDGGIGNFGIRDQIAALGWIHRNIGVLGGDPTRVLIAGESAGGAAVCTLAGAPGAQGLFSAAAIESGPCRLALALTTPTGTFPAAEGYGAVAVAAPLGCTSGDIAACLRGKSVAQILALNLPFYWDLGLPVFATLPVVDGVVLDQRPLAALRAGRGAVPLIVGSNHDDASVFIYQIGVTDTAGAFDGYLHTIGQAAHQTALDALYPVATLGERGAAIRYATDVAFGCASLQVTAAHVAPTYLYELERPVPNGPLAMYQSVHGFDFVNLFGTFSSWQVTPGAADLATSADIQAQWGALAHGVTPANWPASSGADPSFRKLDDPPTIATGWRDGRCAQLAALGVLGD